MQTKNGFPMTWLVRCSENVNIYGCCAIHVLKFSVNGNFLNFFFKSLGVMLILGHSISLYKEPILMSTPNVELI